MGVVCRTLPSRSCVNLVLTLASGVADMFPNATVRVVDLFPAAGDLDAPELRD
jgi:hypothetical protein